MFCSYRLKFIFFFKLFFFYDLFVGSLYPQNNLEKGSYQWIVEPKYQSIGPFDEGLAPFGLNNKFGYIDKKGNVVIPAMFAGYMKFSEGLASVEKKGESHVSLASDNKWGYITPNGTFSINPQYEYAAPFSNGVAGVKIDGKYGFIDKSGNIIVEPQYKYVYNTFSEGLLALSTLDSKFGYIDVDGNFVIPAKYSGANSFSEGLASVKEKYYWGYINHDGELVIPMEYQQASPFKDGLAKVQKGNKWGFINKNGEEVVKIMYEDINSISEGLISCKLNGKWGFVNMQGEVVIPHSYDKTGNFFDGLAPAKKGEFWGYINKEDKVVIPFIYQAASDFFDGYARIKQNGKWGYIDKYGNTILEPQFEDATEIKDLYARVKKDGKWGLILFKRMAKENYLVLKGKVFDAKTKKPLRAEIMIEELSTGKLVQKTSSADNGEYKSQKLEIGKKYGIYAIAKGYIAENGKYTNTDSSKTVEAVVDIKMYPIEVNQQITLNNVFFEFGKAAILPSSYPDLDLLVKILKENPTLRIEIAGHTDNRGSKEKNLQVSRDRARTLKSYLVKKGIDPERIETVGYGASRPIASNDTEEGRTRNRRVEYVILSK
jgi:outer membrane protein OmpA-like peptidoglycan-associated protein